MAKNKKKLKIGVACGGTGGHVFPGLATAYELINRGHQVTLWLTGNDGEHNAVENWSGNIITISSEGFQYGFSIRSLQTLFRLFKAYRLAHSEIRKQLPDVMLAMGSYASLGPVMAARKMGIPYLLHEANFLPGRAISLLAKKADIIAVSFEKTGYYLKHRHVVWTGMPLRKEIRQACLRSRDQHKQGQSLRLLVTGGSHGAQVLNEIVPEALLIAAAKGVKIEVTHITGPHQNTKAVHTNYKSGGIKASIHPFFRKMEECYLHADLVICRSGASTCAELTVFGLPALLVPYPHAGNHQMSNARVLQDVGAADVVDEKELTATWLGDYLISVAQKPAKLERMATAMKKRAQCDAAPVLAGLVERVGESRT